MSALDSSRALNALNLKPQNAAISAASPKNRDPVPEAKDETDKARFARLLDHSRAAAAAAQQPPGRSAREATDSASPRRADRHAAKDHDDNAAQADDVTPSRASNERPGSAARSRSARDDAPDQTADGSVPDEAASAAHASDEDGHPVQANGGASDLASLLGLGRPLAPAVPPPGSEKGMATGDGTANALSAAAPPLTALGQAGIDASANPATGVNSDASAASELATTSPEDRGLRPGQAALPPASSDPKATIDATTASNALPNAALAHLAALSLGVGKSDEGPKTPFALDALPPGASAAIAGQSVAHLARSIDSPAAATVSTPVGDPGFHEALAAQVSVFARGGLSKAELHLNPAELGPVSVHITMNGDQARVDFGADRAQTRQVIEAGWAELATSLQDAGFTLSGGGVSEQAQRQASQREAARPSGRAERSAEPDDAPVASIIAARPRAGSALDLYA
jgi:flagellar hook-length control protein FliK